MSLPRIPKVASLLETSTEYGRGLLKGIVRYSRLHGPWSLYIAPGHYEQELPKAKSWGGTGIIARISSPALGRAIQATGLPAVVLEACFDESPMVNPSQGFCEVRTDSPSIARMAADHLLEHGFRNFLFCGFENCPWSFARENTFCQYVTDKGFRCQSYRTKLRNWMDHANWVRAWEQDQPRLSAWLRTLLRPIGVMVCNDICGRLVLQACTEAALCVPRDFGVVGVDNDELLCELSDPPLSSVALDLDRAGYEAAQVLDGLMSGQIKGRHVVMVNPLRVVTRRSSDTILQEDVLVADALRFIMDHTRQAIRVPDLVVELGVSRRSLERRFFRAVGNSILGEITRCRLERAQRLLRETNLPVCRVATESGFGSVKAFRRAFRLAEACSPSTFRFYANQGAEADPAAKRSRVRRNPTGAPTEPPCRWPLYSHILRAVETDQLLDEASAPYPPAGHGLRQLDRRNSKARPGVRVPRTLPRGSYPIFVAETDTPTKALSPSNQKLGNDLAPSSTENHAKR